MKSNEDLKPQVVLGYLVTTEKPEEKMVKMYLEFEEIMFVL